MELLQIIAAEGPNGKFIPSDVKEFWWGLVAFLIVVGLLVWKLGPIISKALNGAQEKAIADASAAENAVLEARAQIDAAKAELGDADTEAQRILADATNAAQNLRVESANRTQQLVNEMWAKAQADAEAAKAQARADIANEVAQQAVGAAEQIVRTSLDGQRHGQLIDNYIAGLGASS